MTITVRYFASLREALGPSETLAFPLADQLTDQLTGHTDITTLRDLRDHLIARGGRFADVLGRGRALRCAIHQTMAAEDAVLSDGAEVAFFPPVTGG